MPDWSYQTLLAPTFRALPSKAQPGLRSLLDRFGRSPLAGPLVAFLGHVAPDAGQRVDRSGLALPSPVGVSSRFTRDGDLAALVSRFGVGFVELGPVAQSAGTAHDGRPLLGLEQVQARLARRRSLSSPLAVRLSPRAGQSASAAGAELGEVLEAMAPRCAFVTVSLPSGWTGADRQAFLAGLAAVAHRSGSSLPLLVEAGRGSEGAALVARHAGAAGLWLTDAGDVAAARRAWPEAILACAGGINEPGDAVAALAAGADLVAVDDGLLASGPGLPKRIHEALRHGRQPSGPRPSWGLRTAREPWTGMALMALVMLGAGLVAWMLGVTRILLAYDESFLGMDRAQLIAINPHLIHFLSHDRISFAATTVSFALLFLHLSTQAYSRREHWARWTLIVSGAAGFAGFFLFLGFGYLDPLHLLVWVAALVGYLWGIRRVTAAPPWVAMPDLHNDAEWRRALWGQLLFIGLGVGLVTAGVAVSVVACTSVFVPSDLAFMGTTRAALDAANGKLLAVVAHDRAGFGGALVANGSAVLMTSLWGFRRGARWVWWALLTSGVIGFAGVLWIHAHVGYLDFGHLAPAYLALAVFVVAAGLSRSFLVPRQV